MQKHLCRARAMFAFLLLCAGGAPDAGARWKGETLQGTVESNGTGLKGYKVSLLAQFVGRKGKTEFLGHDTTDADGSFEITYRMPRSHGSHKAPILFLRAVRGDAMLVSVIGQSTASGTAVVNERTTVAMGTAFAQFVKGKNISGNKYGMLNAVHMAANMADPETGELGEVISRPPNGDDTTGLRTFNSIANMVAACVAAEAGCDALFDATTLPGGRPPKTVLEAVANIAKYPWLHVSALFDLSIVSRVYTPTRVEAPSGWSVFLKFTGSFTSEQNKNNLMNGPGAAAIDEKGFLWINDNYVPQPREKIACAGERLIKLYPWGENFPGSPYFGGGLSGAGFGITLAPDGNVWVGNYGFAGVRLVDVPGECPTPPSDSVSAFKPDGTPVRGGADGFTAGNISWPQAIVSDPKGNIWIANCGTDSVTVYPKGKPWQAFNRPIPTGSYGQMKPFAIAIDRRGNAWVTGNKSATLAILDPRGRVVEVIGPTDAHGKTQLAKPVGVAADSRGNIWVSNSDWLDQPCLGGPPDLGPGTDPSIALFLRDPIRKPHKKSPFKGGGLTAPWGIAVDGNDTVWVANFAFPISLEDAPNPPIGPNRVSHFCGMDPSKCPLSKQEVGKAISPDVTGYISDALVRNTGISLDPSGNVWLINNWKQIPIQGNPGGNSVAVMVGAAAPVKTPLIGVPESFDRRGRRPRHWR